MDINKWMNSALPEIVDIMERDILSGYRVDTEDSLSLTARMEIYEILDGLLSVMFPGCYCKESIDREDMNFFINDTLRQVSFKFLKHIKTVLYHFCQKKGREECDECSCEEKAQAIIVSLISTLPEIRRTLMKDIETAYNGDPAATSIDEIILSYPFVDAIATHRIAHALYKLELPLIPRIMSERAHSRTGIDIHPGATIGEGFFIDHGTGVVIGETCSIGKNVKIYQGVTLGALSPFDKEGHPRRGEKRHPDIEDDVIIYANATILGGRTVIGKGSIIGGNTWITSSVPPGSVVYNDRSDR
jgi:serine O-acetyltransferase